MSNCSTKQRKSTRYYAFYRPLLHSVEHVLEHRADYELESDTSYHNLVGSAGRWVEMMGTGLIIIDEHDNVVYAD